MATVSRVLNKTKHVAPSVEEAVLKAAKELDYTPNLLGKNLRKKQTGIILVMLSSLNNSFCSKVVTGITEEAEKKGYSVLVCTTTRTSANKKVYLGLVKNHMADGLIVLDSVLKRDELTALSKTVSVVQVSEYMEDISVPYVSIDNRKAAEEAVSHLLSNGKKRILIAGGDESKSCSSALRYQGYRDALSKYSIPFEESLRLTTETYRETAAKMEAYIKEGNRFDAVFALSDRLAASVQTVIKKHGIRVPEDVEIIGFDNTDDTYMTEPNLSTIAQPQQEMGRKAFLMLHDLLTGSKTESVLLPYELIIRGSSH